MHPGGGGAKRLPHLVGRGRALEIVLGANDFTGDTAERYGYVNRSLPNTELDGFVDALARRVGFRNVLLDHRTKADEQFAAEGLSHL